MITITSGKQVVAANNDDDEDDDGYDVYKQGINFLTHSCARARESEDECLNVCSGNDARARAHLSGNLIVFDNVEIILRQGDEEVEGGGEGKKQFKRCNKLLYVFLGSNFLSYNEIELINSRLLYFWPFARARSADGL